MTHERWVSLEIIVNRFREIIDDIGSINMVLDYIWSDILISPSMKAVTVPLNYLVHDM